MLPDHAHGGHPCGGAHVCYHLFPLLQVHIIITIDYPCSISKHTTRPKGEIKNLPKKMKRLVVLETTEGASFADLKDYKVCDSDSIEQISNNFLN